VEPARDLHPRAELLCPLLERAPRTLRALGHRLDVAAGTEGAAGTGEHDRADLRSTGQARERGLHRLEHRARHRVQPLGPVHRQNRHAVLHLLEEIHRVTSRAPAAGKGV